jgi:uncharacterized protein YbjT (DUF2867 family)
MRVVVAGATGCVGRRLVPALLADGHEVTALTREPSAPRATALSELAGVTVVRCDLLDSGPVALPDADAGYYLVHSLGSGEGYADRDRRAARAFAAAATEAGLDRVVYLGGLGPADRLAGHLRSRRAVEGDLADGDYRLVTLRAAIVVGPDSEGFRLLRQCAALRVVLAPPAIRTPCQPVALGDAVRYLRGALSLPTTAGSGPTAYGIGGPEVVGYDELLRRTAATAGHRLWVRPVPGLGLTAATWALALATDVPRSVVGPLVRSLPVPAVVTDDAVREHLPFERTPLGTAIARALPGGDREPDPGVAVPATAEGSGSTGTGPR